MRRRSRACPILNRRFTAFELLTPGVQATTSQTASSEDPQGSYRKVVNGQSFAGSAHLLDGTDNHDALLGLIVVNPTLESVTEAKVTTANYDAEFGATAGVISAQTKSGTNSFHGAVSHFLRNDVFNARNPFTQFQKIPGTDRYIPVTHWNQFGGALGGPVAEERGLLLRGLSGDAAKHRRFGAAARAVGGRTSGRSERAGRRHLRPGDGATLADRQQFAGNRIPAARLSPQAQNLLELIPLPNIEGTVRDQPNYVGSGTIRFNEDLANTRWDYFRGQTHLFGRYSLADYRMDSPGIFGELAGGRGFDEVAPFAGVSRTRNQSIAAGFDPPLGSNLADRFPVWLVPLSRQRRSRAAAM